MATVRIPPPFRGITGNQREVSVSGATAGAVLDELVRRFPELNDALYDDKGELRTTTGESINVLLGTRDIRELRGRDTPVSDSDRLLILRTWPAAISGGSREA